MQGKAILKYARLSPTKSRLVARTIVGMNAELALASLEFTCNKATRAIYKLVASAVANAQIEPEDAVITNCRVDSGPVLKRIKPRSRGMASRIRKPTAHILVEVKRSEESK